MNETTELELCKVCGSLKPVEGPCDSCYGLQRGPGGFLAREKFRIRVELGSAGSYVHQRFAMDTKPILYGGGLLPPATARPSRLTFHRNPVILQWTERPLSPA